jgi:hypothetical protein
MCLHIKEEVLDSCLMLVLCTGGARAGALVARETTRDDYMALIDCLGCVSCAKVSSCVIVIVCIYVYLFYY